MKIFLTLLIFIFAVPSWGMNEKFVWKEYLSRDGVTIYRAKKSAASAGIVPIKAKTIINHNIAKVLSVLSENNKKQLWVPSLLVSHHIKEIGEHEWTEYARYHSPWPFDDRDFVIHVKGEWDKEKREAMIRLWSTESPEKPINPKYVRGHTYAGYARVLDLGNNRTEVEVMFLTDFKGNIPKWIINMVQKKWPLKMFHHLKTYMNSHSIVPSPKYQKFN